MQLTDDSTIENWTTSRPSCQRCQCVRMTRGGGRSRRPRRHAGPSLRAGRARRPRATAGRATTTATKHGRRHDAERERDDRVPSDPAVRLPARRPAGDEQADGDRRHRRVGQSTHPLVERLAERAGCDEPVAEQEEPDVHTRSPATRRPARRSAATPGWPARPRARASPATITMMIRCPMGENHWTSRPVSIRSRNRTLNGAATTTPTSHQRRIRCTSDLIGRNARGLRTGPGAAATPGDQPRSSSAGDPAVAGCRRGNLQRDDIGPERHRVTVGIDRGATRPPPPRAGRVRRRRGPTRRVACRSAPIGSRRSITSWCS